MTPEMEKMIQNQKSRENDLADILALELERAFKYAHSEISELSLDMERAFVRNNVAKQLEVVYNELVETYPEYEDELYELLPNKFNEDVVSLRTYFKLVAVIGLLGFIRTFLEHMFGEFEDNTFHLYRDNVVLGNTIIDRLVKNAKHLIYVIVAWANEWFETGKIPEGAFKVSRANVSWFKAIITDYYTYYTRYKYLWELSSDGVEFYEFYTSEDEKVCGECSPLHEEQFKVSEAIVGVNLPPIHNRCRCWIVGIED